MPSTDGSSEAPHPAWYLLVVLTAGLCSLAIAFFVKGGIGDMDRLQERKAQLREQIVDKRKTYRRLKDRRKRLHRDPYLIEKIARQRLGLGRPGEKRVRLEDLSDTALPGDGSRVHSTKVRRVEY
jgi:cell division protein FtsB